MIFNNFPAIEIQNLSLCFNGRQVLDRVSLVIDRNSHVIITGESGTGKTSILKSILGFIEPEQGIIRIMGEELNGKSVWNLRKQIAYIQQEPEYKDTSVKEVLMMPFQFKANAGLESPIDEVRGLFERFNLSADLLEEKISSLSGGEKQRVAIVSALLLRRPVLLVDEFTSALDDKNSAAIIDYFMGLKDTTVLAVAHDKSYISRADRIVELEPNPDGGACVRGC